MVIFYRSFCLNRVWTHMYVIMNILEQLNRLLLVVTFQRSFYEHIGNLYLISHAVTVAEYIHMQLYRT